MAKQAHPLHPTLNFGGRGPIQHHACDMGIRKSYCSSKQIGLGNRFKRREGIENLRAKQAEPITPDMVRAMVHTLSSAAIVLATGVECVRSTLVAGSPGSLPRIGITPSDQRELGHAGQGHAQLGFGTMR